MFIFVSFSRSESMMWLHKSFWVSTLWDEFNFFRFKHIVQGYVLFTIPLNNTSNFHICSAQRGSWNMFAKCHKNFDKFIIIFDTKWIKWALNVCVGSLNVSNIQITHFKSNVLFDVNSFLVLFFSMNLCTEHIIWFWRMIHAHS